MQIFFAAYLLKFPWLPEMVDTLKDKLVVLTGASGGIGRAIAEKLDAQGARLILVGRNEQKLQQLDRQLG